VRGGGVRARVKVKQGKSKKEKETRCHRIGNGTNPVECALKILRAFAPSREEFPSRLRAFA